MASGSVLITTGAAFAESSEAAVRFLEKIIACGTVALGVGVGQHGHIEHVCPEMIARAKELRLPLFEIAETVPFRGVFAYVYNALASTDMYHLRRAVSVQAQLLDLLIEEKGIGEVLARLAGILGMTLLLFDSQGRLVAHGGADDLGPGELDRIWRTYQTVDDPGPLDVLEADHGRLRFRETRVFGSVERVLAAVVHQPPTSEFVEIALSFAHRLVHLELLREREEIALGRRMRALLLDDLLSRPDVEEDLRVRLLDQGVDLRRAWRVIVFGGVDSPTSYAGKPDSKESYKFRTQVCAVAEAHLRKRRLDGISMVKSDQMVMLAVVDGLDHEATRALLVELCRTLDEEGGWPASVWAPPWPAGVTPSPQPPCVRPE